MKKINRKILLGMGIIWFSTLIVLAAYQFYETSKHIVNPLVYIGIIVSFIVSMVGVDVVYDKDL